jgi:hypothetical protein
VQNGQEKAEPSEARVQYACWGCGDEIPWPVDAGDTYCDLCMALIMFEMEAEAREKTKR